MFAELAASLVWTAVGLFVAWQARVLGVGALNEPGPGMLAFGLGVLIAIIGAASFLRPLVRPPKGGLQLTAMSLTPRTLRMIGLCIGLAAYIAVLQPVGYPLATFVFFLLLLRVFANLSWLRALGFSACVAAASYLLFKLGLGTQLPAGILG